MNPDFRTCQFGENEQGSLLIFKGGRLAMFQRFQYSSFFTTPFQEHDIVSES